ncbi:thymidine kinase 2, mitochondrial isoform X1 [Lates japonicus]|uniref:Thymidine kinase 2, mitochondrial isoform X1 n=1 Tax=Lates japonicus TaxID=270547 RepID=A0AAD3RE11_LATJO|nr:thymidine kinase 2, mitochondrial isoform X1 [Lates japonicus]
MSVAPGGVTLLSRCVRLLPAHCAVAPSSVRAGCNRGVRLGAGSVSVFQSRARSGTQHRTPGKLVRNGEDKKAVVCIEGNIASGKTTCLEYFSKTSNIEVLTEPVSKWRNVRGHNPLVLMYRGSLELGHHIYRPVQRTCWRDTCCIQAAPVRMMERSIFSAKYIFVRTLQKVLLPGNPVPGSDQRD